jgi:DNA-binding transcriptional MerR regulator
VTTAYKIKDIAERSGFTAATLRYYEGIGLLPEPTRTPAGYRLYDDHTLDRLAFIARAKQLGCTLDEISELTLAWEGGQCGPVQDRLRAVVADKLVDAQQQIVELMTLSSELQQAATTLELHRPDGPCDEQCGCVTNPVPIACTISSASMRRRLDDWQALLVHVIGREQIADGVRVTFSPATPLDDLIRLTAAEHDCCQFFSFAITVDSRGVALEVRSPPEALDVVHSLFGMPV